MQNAFRLLPAAAVLALASLSNQAFAATTVYTSSAAFLPNVAPGAYLNTFTGLTNPAPVSFSSGGFSYGVSSPGGLYVNGNFLGTNLPADPLVVTFTSGNVTAVGGNFYNTNISDIFQSTQVTLTLSDGTTRSYTPSSVTDSYTGFTSTTFITSLTINGAAGVYAGMDNLTVGVAAVIPEPGTWLLMSLGVGGLLLARQRRTA